MKKLILTLCIIFTYLTPAQAIEIGLDHMAAHYYGTVIARDIFHLDPLTTLLLSNVVGFWKEMQDEKQTVGSFNELDIFYNNMGVMLAWQVDLNFTERPKTKTGGIK
jgi:hypothetical protein